MSGIVDRVHVFMEGQRWWIEAPSGKGYLLPAGIDFSVVMAEAVTLHDNPAAIRAVRGDWLRWCPICERHKREL